MKKTAVLLTSTLLPLFAWAHTGGDAGVHHGSALLLGFLHPFSGLDHLAAMLAVGVWSVLCFRQQGRRMWLLPVAFATLLLCGGLLGVAGLQLPLVEPLIAASLLALGLLIAYRVRLPLSLAAGIVGAFAVSHGLAHGAELPAAAATAALSGMLAATLLLHLAGMALGHWAVTRHRWLPRLAGLGVAAFGLGLLAS